MATDRETLKLVVVGHVDHGKSTVIGRLLYDTESLPAGAVEKVKRISRDTGKPFEYAYLLDAFEEEQKQGITIDTTQLQFHTGQRDYVIIDAPGHKEFLKNMVSGAANAEAALLVIDAKEGIQEQSKRHGYLLSLLGIQKVYVLVNKMDLIAYSAAKFTAIKREMNEFLHYLQVYPLRYIPISAFYGENVTSRSAKMPWYEGEPLLKAMDLFTKDKGMDQRPLRFPIQDVYKFDNRRIIAGRIEAGTLRAGDDILISPGHKVTKVKSIEHWAARDKQDWAAAGRSVGITVADEFFNKRGEVITHLDGEPLLADTFRANLFWLGKKPLLIRKPYKLKLVTQEVESEISAITKVIDVTTLENMEPAGQLNTNGVAEVIIKTKEKIWFDEFKNNHITGRFVLLDGYDVSGGGIVSGPVREISAVSKFAQAGCELVVHCFDEYFYGLAAGTVKRFANQLRTFRVGDVVPASGKTYEYPEDFDLLAVPGRLVARIRGAKLEDIISLADYRYAGAAVIDSHGFGFQVRSEAEFLSLVADIEALPADDQPRQIEFANKWLDFTAFRSIHFGPAGETAAGDYQI